MSTIYKELGSTVKKYRKNLNITSTEFAEMLNISAGHLSNIENGSYDIFRLELLLKLAEKLNITMEELLQFKYLSLNQIIDKDIYTTINNLTLDSTDANFINNSLNSLAVTYLATMSQLKFDKDKIVSITNHLIDELNLIKKIS